MQQFTLAPSRLVSFHSIESLPSPQQPIFGGAHQHLQRPLAPTAEAKLTRTTDNTFLAIQRVQPPRPPVAGAERQPIVDYVVRLGVSQSQGGQPSKPLATEPGNILGAGSNFVGIQRIRPSQRITQPADIASRTFVPHRVQPSAKSGCEQPVLLGNQGGPLSKPHTGNAATLNSSETESTITKTSGDAWSVDDRSPLDTSDSIVSTEDDPTWDEQSGTSRSSDVASVDVFAFLDTGCKCERVDDEMADTSASSQSDNDGLTKDNGAGILAWLCLDTPVERDEGDMSTSGDSIGAEQSTCGCCRRNGERQVDDRKSTPSTPSTAHTAEKELVAQNDSDVPSPSDSPITRRPARPRYPHQDGWGSAVIQMQPQGRWKSAM